MASNNTCPRCSSTNLVSGDLICEYRYNAKILFRPNASGFFDPRSGTTVSTLVCMDCGSVQMSVDVDTLVNDVVGVLRPDETSADEAPSPAEPIKCLECGATIEAGETKCSKCGWTYVIA